MLLENNPGYPRVQRRLGQETVKTIHFVGIEIRLTTILHRPPTAQIEEKRRNKKKKPGFQIRIDLMRIWIRIRIQHFFLLRIRIPVRVQGLMT
jgi:hypothetical protein